MPRRGTAADIKIGAFVLIALALLIAGSLWIAGATFFGARRIPYVVRLDDSAGLQAGDRVRVAGVTVGRIQQVELLPGEALPVRLEIAMKPAVLVKTDAVAGIETAGLLGAPYLQIYPGSSEAPQLAPEGEITGSGRNAFGKAMGRVDELSAKAIELMDKTGNILDQISGEIGPITERLNYLLSEENVDEVHDLLANMRQTVAEARPRLNQLLERLDGVAENADQRMDELPELTDRVAGLVDDLRTALGPDGARMARVLDAAGDSLSRADDTLAILGKNRHEIDAAMRDLRDTTANLRELSQELKERPHRLIRATGPKDRKPGQGAKGSAP